MQGGVDNGLGVQTPACWNKKKLTGAATAAAKTRKMAVWQTRRHARLSLAAREAAECKRKKVEALKEAGAPMVPRHPVVIATVRTAPLPPLPHYQFAHCRVRCSRWWARHQSEKGLLRLTGASKSCH